MGGPISWTRSGLVADDDTVLTIAARRVPGGTTDDGLRVAIDAARRRDILIAAERSRAKVRQVSISRRAVCFGVTRLWLPGVAGTGNGALA